MEFYSSGMNFALKSLNQGFYVFTSDIAIKNLFNSYVIVKSSPLLTSRYK